MKKNGILYITLIAFLTLMSSCQKDPEPGGTVTQALAGEWWVEWVDDPGTFYHFSTYNTAANSSTEIWIEDNETFWLMKGKIAVGSNLTFSGNSIENVSPDYVGSGATFTVANGKIIQNGTKGPVSKAVTDSIYFEVSFSDDPAPGTIYKMAGYRRTRYAEDDH